MYIGLHVNYRCSCEILIETEYSRHRFADTQVSNFMKICGCRVVMQIHIEFHENPWVPGCSKRPDRQTNQVHSRFSQFCERAENCHAKHVSENS